MSTPAPTPELTTASRRLTAAWQAHDQSPTTDTAAEVAAAREAHEEALRLHLAAAVSVAAVAPEPAPEPAPRSAALTLAERIAAHGRWRRGEPGGARFVAAWREDISDANLFGADLTRADLTRANLPRANLAAIRSDVRRALDAVPAEVPGLLAAFRDGRINGSAYEGDCACFVGTVAKLRGCYYRSIPGVQADPSRPLERFVGAVRRGDTPATNPVSAMVERWIVEWMSERAEVAS